MAPLNEKKMTGANHSLRSIKKGQKNEHMDYQRELQNPIQIPRVYQPLKSCVCELQARVASIFVQGSTEFLSPNGCVVPTIYRLQSIIIVSTNRGRNKKSWVKRKNRRMANFQRSQIPRIHSFLLMRKLNSCKIEASSRRNTRENGLYNCQLRFHLRNGLKLICSGHCLIEDLLTWASTIQIRCEVDRFEMCHAHPSTD